MKMLETPRHAASLQPRTTPLKQKKLEWATHTFEWDHAPNSARTLLHQSRLGNLLKLET
jgi:uncharacterized Rossmann fold enzyme